MFIYLFIFLSSFFKLILLEEWKENVANICTENVYNYSLPLELITIHLIIHAFQDAFECIACTFIFNIINSTQLCAEGKG